MRVHPLYGVVLLLALSLFGIAAVWPQTAAAQPVPTPQLITPGIPNLTPTVVSVTCREALPIQLGSTIYIKPGVNIRNQASASGALVWNTMYDNLDEEGNPLENPLSIPVVVLEGPVCNGGYNWWRIEGTQNPGWVAEGIGDDYYIIALGQVVLNTCVTTPNYALGETIDVAFNARLRAAPDPNSLVKTVVPADVDAVITQAPQCVGSVRWWGVRATVADVTYEGWMAEQEQLGGDYLIRPVASGDQSACVADQGHPIGARAKVDYEDGVPKSLRIAPDEQAALLATLVNGVPLIIEGGPICADGLNWWQVRVLASTPISGWMAEGSPFAGYWITVINPNEFAK